MTLVWEHSAQNGNALLLLLAIADFADDNGISFPSVGRLALKSRMSERNTHYVIKQLVAAGELTVERGAGSRKGTNRYQILVNPTLPMFEIAPGATLAPGAKTGVWGATQGRKGVQPVAPEPSLTVKEPSGSRAARASPVAACFEAYRQGIKTQHGADYPPSASANGMLGQVVKKLGAEAALAVVRAYVASRKPFYVQRKHALEILAKDAPTIWIELQQHAGGGKPPAVASLYVEWNDGAQVRLTDYPTDKPELLARRLLKDYASKFATGRARNIHVQVGAARHAFSVKELAA